MVIPTRFHGNLEISDRDLITFDPPILGFEMARRYVLLPVRPDSPFLYLQSVEQPSLVFVVVDPFVFFATYSLAEERISGIGPAEQWAVLTVCTFYSDGRKPSTNLRSPLIVNRHTRTGGQYVLSHDYGFEVELPPPSVAPATSPPVVQS